MYATTIRGTRYAFPDLKSLMAKATPLRSGDCLAGVAASSEAERAAAQIALADLPLATFLQELLVPYEEDEVTRLILDTHDSTAFAPVASLTVGEFRDWLLSDAATDETLAALAPGLTPEMAAAVAKISRNQDLVAVAAKRRVVTRFRDTLGLAGRLSSRIQPNHPTDDPKGILASAIDGLLLGNGDAVIGVNPASDSPERCYELLRLLDELRESLDIPTQSCVLSHVTTTIDLMARGAPVDLVFQSIAGTQGANRSFGVDLALLREAHEAALALRRGILGDNLMYFETGQGSALSAGAHHGCDQQTLEARALASRGCSGRCWSTPSSDSSARNISSTASRSSAPASRITFVGKLLGLPMGCDACYTNHAEADQNDIDDLLTLLAVAGVNYVMGVPGADNVMLNYQSTSYHDVLAVRRLLRLAPAPEFEHWLAKMGMTDERGSPKSQLPAAVQPLLARA